MIFSADVKGKIASMPHAGFRKKSINGTLEKEEDDLGTNQAVLIMYVCRL